MRKRGLIPKRQESKSRWHSLEEYETALRSCMGFKSECARILNVAPATVTNRIDGSEYLQNILFEITEESLDTAERQLHEAVLAREGWAVLFVLRCKGKSRGWQERQQVDIDIRPAGVLQVPFQFESSKAWEAVAIKHQKQLMQNIDNEFRNDEGNSDVSQQDYEEQPSFEGE